jgi:hypothetical protein
MSMPPGLAIEVVKKVLALLPEPAVKRATAAARAWVSSRP